MKRLIYNSEKVRAVIDDSGITRLPEGVTMEVLEEDAVDARVEALGIKSLATQREERAAASRAAKENQPA